MSVRKWSRGRNVLRRRIYYVVVSATIPGSAGLGSRTRSYVVFAAKHIRQIPRSVLNHNSVADLFAAVQVDCLEIVGE